MESLYSFRPGTVLKARDPAGDQLRAFSFGERLYDGASSLIFEAWEQEGRGVIIKTPLSRGSEDLTRHIERTVLRKARSPNLPAFLAHYENSANQVFLVQERLFENPLRLMNRPAIRDQIDIPHDREARYVPLPGPTALELSCELLLALRALHSRGFIHGDVRLENLMVRPDYRTRELSEAEVLERVRLGAYRGVLIDYGASRSLDYLAALEAGEDPELLPPSFTPIFGAPELFEERPRYTPAMDLYSAALVIYTLYTGHPPYSHAWTRVDPGNRQKVAELKEAERRGDIAPASGEVINKVRLADASLAKGSEREVFDQALLNFLDRYSHPDPAERQTIEQMLAELTELGRFETSGYGIQDARPEARQGVFALGSSLERLGQAARALERRSAPQARRPEPRPSSGSYQQIPLRRLPGSQLRRVQTRVIRSEHGLAEVRSAEMSGFSRRPSSDSLKKAPPDPPRPPSDDDTSGFK